MDARVGGARGADGAAAAGGAEEEEGGLRERDVGGLVVQALLPVYRCATTGCAGMTGGRRGLAARLGRERERGGVVHNEGLKEDVRRGGGESVLLERVNRGSRRPPRHRRCAKSPAARAGGCQTSATREGKGASATRGATKPCPSGSLDESGKRKRNAGRTPAWTFSRSTCPLARFLRMYSRTGTCAAATRRQQR